jgi:predicted DsbA family dithiol-disulfide isomerase
MSERQAPLCIDFITDVTCPWCAIGLQALLRF